MQVRFLLVGNYGVGNLGDEALKDYFLRSFPEVQWTVISAHPEDQEVPRFPMGIRSLLSLRWFRTLRALRQSRGMVFGGGSLLTDQESVRACFLWGLHAFVAWLYGKPYLFAFQGIGPFRTTLGERIARSVVAHAAFLSVRDPLTAERIRSWKMNTKFIQSFDPVFRLMYDKKTIVRTQKIFTVIPRASDVSQPEKYHIPAGSTVRILLLEPESLSERSLAEAIHARHPDSSILSIRTLEQLLTEVAQATTVLSARFHGALAAVALEKELQLLSQGEGDKLSSLRHLPPATELLALVRTGEEALKTALHGISSR